MKRLRLNLLSHAERDELSRQLKRRNGGLLNPTES
jgi:hypothetical protein